MIGIVFLVLILRAIGKRAHDKGKNQYAFWAIGVGVWFGSQFILGVLIALLFPDFILGEGEDSLLLRFIGIIFSACSVGLLYMYLDRLPDPDLTKKDLVDQIGEDPEEPVQGV